MDAARGGVTSFLFSVKDFQEILDLGEKKYQLTPLFDISTIRHYFPLLESSLTSDSIAIHVPSQSGEAFEVFKLESFPFSANGSILTLDLPSSVVLVHRNFSIYATGRLSD